VRLLCILPTARLRRAVGKFVRCADELNKLEKAALFKWLGDSMALKPRKGHRSVPSDSIYFTSAALFCAFAPLDGEMDAPGGDDNESPDSRTDASNDCLLGEAAAAGVSDTPGSTCPRPINDADENAAGRPTEPVTSSAKPVVNRSGICAPALSKIPASHHMQKSAALTFLLSLFGEPCVEVFDTIEPKPVLPNNTDMINVATTDPMLMLVMKLRSDDVLAFYDHAAALATAGFVTSVLFLHPRGPLSATAPNLPRGVVCSQP